MHLFVGDKSLKHVHVYTPNVTEHKHKFGLPLASAIAGTLVCRPTGLKDLEPNTDPIVLTGPEPGSVMFSDLVSHVDHVVLQKNKGLDIIGSAARNHFILPTPDIIRCFRNVEVDADEVMGGTDRRLFLKPPKCIHEI